MDKSKLRYVFVLYSLALVCVCMFMIYPNHDDWGYTVPKPGMNLSVEIMPAPTFWRPFDKIFEYLLGYAPCLFPYINRAVSLAGHFLLCFILYKTLKRLTNNDANSCIGTLFFCMSPGITCTITNADYMNQIWAMVTGITAAFFFFRARLSSKKHYYLLWLFFAFLSVLVKENGIVWFIAPVMLYIVYSFMNGENFLLSIRKNFVYILIGAAGMALYFAVRFYLMGGIVLGNPNSDKGRYMLNFSIIHIIRNYCLMIGGAATSVDSLALFLKPRNYPVITATLIVSIIFLSFMLANVRNIFKTNRKLFYVITGLFVCAGYISSPYAVLGHNGEVTAYEMAFMCGLMTGIILSCCKRRKISSAVLLLMFVSMFMVTGHKVYTMHNYTKGIHDFLQAHKADFASKPKNAYVYFIEDIPNDGYATYTYTIGHGLEKGIAFNSLWDWQTKFFVNTVSDDANIDSTFSGLYEYDTIFSLTRSGTLKVLRN